MFTHVFTALQNFNQPTDGPEAPMDGTALSPVDKKTARKSIEVTETTIKAQIVAINNGHSSPPMVSNFKENVYNQILCPLTLHCIMILCYLP